MMSKTHEEMAAAYAKGRIGRRLMNDTPLDQFEILEIREMLKIQNALLAAGYYARDVDRRFVDDEVVISARRLSPGRIEKLDSILDDEACLEARLRLEIQNMDRLLPQEHAPGQST
jgi:hypothetical protein